MKGLLEMLITHLQFSPFHREEDESFDIMIKYGDEVIYNVVQRRICEEWRIILECLVIGNGICRWLLREPLYG